MNLEVMKHGDSRLTSPAFQFDFQAPPFDAIAFAQELCKTMYDLNVITLAANQVGVPYRIFAMRGAPQNFVCFNPRIVLVDNEEVRLEETNPCWPGLIVPVKRPKACKVRFAHPNGQVQTETYTGMTARVFQHSMDVLNGVLWYQNSNDIHRAKAFRKWKNSQRK